MPLTICIDKVAASGGYMMACIGEKISAPFAILGSIGVVAQLPNVNRLLKKHDIDFEVLTAGEYKRTLTAFGENTEKGREKFQGRPGHHHQLFKNFVSRYRPQLAIDEVATRKSGSASPRWTSNWWTNSRPAMNTSLNERRSRSCTICITPNAKACKSVSGWRPVGRWIAYC